MSEVCKSDKNPSKIIKIWSYNSCQTARLLFLTQEGVIFLKQKVIYLRSQSYVLCQEMSGGCLRRKRELKRRTIDEHLWLIYIRGKSFSTLSMIIKLHSWPLSWTDFLKKTTFNACEEKIQFSVEQEYRNKKRNFWAVMGLSPIMKVVYDIPVQHNGNASIIRNNTHNPKCVSSFCSLCDWRHHFRHNIFCIYLLFSLLLCSNSS